MRKDQSLTPYGTLCITAPTRIRTLIRDDIHLSCDLHNSFSKLQTTSTMKLQSLASAFLIVATTGLLSHNALAQDPTVVDSTHYKVEFENDDVRVVRITYGAGEKSVMHVHPANVAIFLTNGSGQFTSPDGTTVDFDVKAGETLYGPGGTHLPENTGDAPLEIILVELKK